MIEPAYVAIADQLQTAVREILRERNIKAHVSIATEKDGEHGEHMYFEVDDFFGELTQDIFSEVIEQAAARIGAKEIQGPYNVSDDN